MRFKDYYKILGLETSRITLQQLKEAYRESAKKYHPDVNVGDRIAEERFKDVNEAYKILSNPSTKRKYDRIWNSNVGRKKKKEQENQKTINVKFSDLFSMFFGTKKEEVRENKTSNKIKDNKIIGEDIETEIDLTIEETYYGCSKKISLRTTKGKMKTFNIKIPSGIRDKEKIRLIGQGKSGLNGGKNGDLLIRVNIKDSKNLKLIGINLYTDLYITPSEAALGAKIKLSTIEDEIIVFVPSGINSGEIVKLKGKGYRDGKGGRGDLIVEVKIMVPKELSKEEKELYNKLSEISTYNPRIIKK